MSTAYLKEGETVDKDEVRALSYGHAHTCGEHIKALLSYGRVVCALITGCNQTSPPARFSQCTRLVIWMKLAITRVARATIPYLLPLPRTHFSTCWCTVGQQL